MKSAPKQRPAATEQVDELAQVFAALDLGIDMADLDSQGREDLSQLIHLLGGAEGRIDVAVEDVSERTILVSFRSSARTQDSREPYGLGEALDVLSEYARPDAVGGETDG